QLEGRLAGPAAGAFLLRLVLYHVDERAIRAVRALGQDVGGDLDQVRLQPALVPLAKDGRQLRWVQSNRRTKQVVALCDQLDVGIFDAVVNHLHEVTCAVWSDVRAARNAIDLGRDRGQDLFDVLIGSTGSARHQARAAQRAFLPARHSHTEETESGSRRCGGTAARVVKQRVAAVDDDVAGLEKHRQRFDAFFYRLAGFDLDEIRSRRVDIVAELLQRSGGVELALRAMR